MTWVYLKTNRSILTGFMLHLACNFTINLFQPYDSQIDILVMAAILALSLALCLPPNRQSKYVLPQTAEI